MGQPPLHVIKKSDGNFRRDCNYRALNRITKSDKYHIPNINSFADKLAKKTRLNKVGLLSVYDQIEMHPDDIKKTAFISPLGLH